MFISACRANLQTDNIKQKKQQQKNPLTSIDNISIKDWYLIKCFLPIAFQLENLIPLNFSIIRMISKSNYIRNVEKAIKHNHYLRELLKLREHLT